MAEAQCTFSQTLLEKLIPSARKPLSDISLAMMAPGLDIASKARLKMELQKCWAQCNQRIDHRQLCEQAVEITFARQVHYIAKAAVDEFERQKKLYNDYFTVGLKQQVDGFAQSRRQQEAEARFDVTGWRLSGSELCDFRRRNGERLLLVTKVELIHPDGVVEAKTSNISNGGCLLIIAPEQASKLLLLSSVQVEFSELANKYAINNKRIGYEIVDIKPAVDNYKVALRRTSEGDSNEFDQLVQSLMNEHKRRNRLDVDNTINALRARCHNMAAITQLNALILMSHRNDKYHLLLSQGHTLTLQAELMLNQDLLPHLLENHTATGSKLYFVWASSRSAVYVADLPSLSSNDAFAGLAKVWSNALWHKVFLVKSDKMDASMADMGTSIPSAVSKVAEKLNQPLPPKVAQFSRELGKVSLIEDVSYIMNGVVPLQNQDCVVGLDLAAFRLSTGKGCLRQTPFDIKTLPTYHGSYRLTQDCQMAYRGQSYDVINGHVNCRNLVLSMPLKRHQFEKGTLIDVDWTFGLTRISLKAKVLSQDPLDKSLSLEWQKEPRVIKQWFKELVKQEAITPVFSEDVQHHKLDVALRNLILSNLPKTALFCQAKKQAVALTALTGHQYLPQCFIDSSNRARLDSLFSPKILHQLVKSADQHKETLLLAVADGKVTQRRLLSEFSSPKLMLKILKHWFANANTGSHSQTKIYAFAVAVSRSRDAPEDAIITLENKYLRHYSPGKANKLEDKLAFNLAIQLTDMSGAFDALISHC